MFQTVAALVLVLVLSSALLFGDSLSVYGVDSDDEIESIEDEIEEVQDAAEELEEEIEQAESDAAALESEISALNTQLSELSNSIEELNTQITEKEAEIEALEAEIEAAEASIAENEEAAQTQYESLTAWIQVSYENNFDTMFMSVLAADSISELLVRAEYVQSLTEFGTDLIKRYNETITALNAQKAELEEQNETLNASLESLEALEEEASEKKAQVASVIAETREALSAVNSSIDSLEAELAEQEAYEAELEEQRAQAEAAQAAEIAAQEAALAAADAAAAAAASDSSSDSSSESSSSSSSSSTYVSTDSDLDLLAALIYCEAGSEIYEGKVAVGCVVMNRVRSSSFPNTVSGVIYQSGQFGPASSGRLATVLANGLASDSCYEAASYVLAGNLPYSTYLYFCSASISLSISTTVIGNHQFY